MMAFSASGGRRVARGPGGWLALAAFGALASCATPRPPIPAQQFDVFFVKDETTLTPEGQEVVQKIAKTARTVHPGRVTVEGQADGGTAHDAEVAHERGQHVAAALIAAGLAPAMVQQVPGAPPPNADGIAAHKVVVRLDKA